jgi:hypothetical protein
MKTYSLSCLFIQKVKIQLSLFSLFCHNRGSEMWIVYKRQKFILAIVEVGKSKINALVSCKDLLTVFLSFVFDNTGVWTQGFASDRQGLYYLSHTSSPFCFFGYVLDKVLHFCLGLASDCNPPTSTSCVAGIAGMHHNTRFLQNF